MKKSNNDERFKKDQLVDFTDHILNEKKTIEDKTSFATDPELRALEQTAMRLKQAFHEDGPSEMAIKRMHNHIVTQWQEEKIKKNQPFWEKWITTTIPSVQQWQSQRNRQRRSIAISVTALVILVLVCVPFFSGIDSDQTAASGHYLNFGLLAASGGLILFSIWLFHHKK